MKYRADIDGLRAIAITLVLLFHFFPGYLPGGFIGVDIFFVISGYLITTIINHEIYTKSFSPVIFYQKRIKRLFPALILVLCTSFLYGFFTLLPSELRELGKEIAGGAGFVSNFIFWIDSGYFDSISYSKPLLNLWSLAIEEQFYIIWPWFLIIGTLFKKNLKIILICACASFTLNIFFYDKDISGGFYSPLARFWEILVGGLLSVLIDKNYLKINESRYLSFTGITLIILGLVVINEKVIYPSWYALIPTGGAALLILSSPKSFFNKYLLSNRVLVFIGVISYPLYLWHWPIISFVKIKFGQNLDFYYIIIMAGFTIIISIATHYLLERPIKKMDGKFSSIYLMLIMIITFFIGIYTYQSNGFPERYLKEEIISKNIDSNLTAHELIKENILVDGDGAGFRPSQDFLRDLINYPIGIMNQPTGCDATITYGSINLVECHKVNTKSNKSMVLVGDSMAQSLYPGFVNLPLKFNFSTYYLLGCPPSLEYDPKEVPECSKANSKIIEFIKKTKPDVLLLFGLWWHKVPPSKVQKFIEFSLDAGAKEIYVIGNSPKWKDDLPKALLNAYKTNGYLQTRITPTLMDGFLESENNFQNLITKVQSKHIKYISLMDILCNEIGCTVLSDTSSANSLIQIDRWHLSNEGSKYVVPFILEFMRKNNSSD